MVKVFEFGRRLGEEYWVVLEYIDEYGNEYVNERGQKYKEAEPILIEVKYPIFGRPSEVLPEYVIQRWGENFIWDYACRVAWCKSEPGQWTYSYGERLAEENQIENIIKKLKEYPDTRQATCVLYWPKDTLSAEPPCMCLVDFKIRSGGIRTFAYFRSNDMENAYPSNYYDLLMLSYRLASELERPIDRITTFSASAHIYRW